MKIEEFNKLKKGSRIRHYTCNNGVSGYESGTVLHRDKRNSAFVRVKWECGRESFTDKELIDLIISDGTTT